MGQISKHDQCFVKHLSKSYTESATTFQVLSTICKSNVCLHSRLLHKQSSGLYVTYLLLITEGNRESTAYLTNVIATVKGYIRGHH